MFDIHSRRIGAPPAFALNALEFLRVELSPMVDGRIRVSLTVTTFDDDEQELLDQDVVSRQVDSMEDVLSLIRTHVHVSAAPRAPAGARQ